MDYDYCQKSFDELLLLNDLVRPYFQDEISVEIDGINTVLSDELKASTFNPQQLTHKSVSYEIGSMYQYSFTVSALSNPVDDLRKLMEKMFEALEKKLKDIISFNVGEIYRDFSIVYMLIGELYEVLWDPEALIDLIENAIEEVWDPEPKT